MTERSEPALLSRGWWRDRVTYDLPASFVVFLVALPLSMGIAIASGAPVTSGLVAGIVGGIVAGSLAGSPLGVSGPAAGLTVVVAQCIQEHGIEALGVVVLMVGVLQVLSGVLRLGQWFRAVSPSVVQGMLAGIGVLIFSSQFHVMVDDKPKEQGIANLLTIPESIGKALPWQREQGAAPDRATHALRLRQAGLLHLQQTEIAEEIHHRLAGLPDGVADPAAGGHEAGKPGGEAADERVASPLAGELFPAEHRKQLVTAQKRILEEISLSEAGESTEALREARSAVSEALADLESGNVDAVRRSQDRAADAIGDLRDSLKSHRWAAGLGVLTIVTLVTWHGLFGRRWKFLPAPLVAAALATITAASLDLPVLYVEVPDNLLEEIYLPSMAELRNALNPGLVLMAVEIAIVASAQSLLTATAVDQMHQGPRTRYDRELLAQGVGNIVCGLFAALPMAGVIVRSGANVQAGARSRWSSILHGLWLLLFVAGLSVALRHIPTASLAAILVYTGYKLVNLQTIRSMLVYGRSEAAIYVGTMVSIVVTDLLTGVLIGIGLSILKLVYTFSRLKVSLRRDPEVEGLTLILRGSATFLRLPRLASVLEKVPAGSALRVDCDRLTYIDPACLELLKTWEQQHRATGGTVVIDWNALTARFSADPASGAVRHGKPDERGSPVVRLGHATDIGRL
jgi:MFS superfamily sulfate permease-like transporter